MGKGVLGQVLALLGLILLLLIGMGRQRTRGQQRQPSPGFQRWQQWGSFAALALILVGLLLMTWFK